jgi:SagB-type dehydrogenase family enzyme
MTPTSPTAEFASLVYGSRGVSMDDPAETLHEASRLYPNVAPGRVNSMLALARNPELQETVARSSRTHGHRPVVELPQRPLPDAGLVELLQRRRSSLGPGRLTLRLDDLATILGASYRSTPREGEGPRRPVPSAGALYPLEVYVIVLAVERIEPSVLHYDPFRHRLSRLDALGPDSARRAVVDGGLVDRAAAILVVTSLFWRSRFKYGARGYRFALLEAGHLVQNAILAAAALDLPALPLGGFFDRRLDALVRADGIEESSVYALLLGGRAA